MANRLRKQRLWRGTNVFPVVIGDAPVVSDRIVRRKNTAWENAKKLRKQPTRAEQELELILNSLNNGVLQGQFFTQWAFADKWILDFFFHKNRLGIEVDGAIHQTPQQRARDKEKEAACVAWDITLVRISNVQVFGPREALVRILRSAWKEAGERFESSVFASR